MSFQSNSWFPLSNRNLWGVSFTLFLVIFMWKTGYISTLKKHLKRPHPSQALLATKGIRHIKFFIFSSVKALVQLNFTELESQKKKQEQNKFRCPMTLYDLYFPKGECIQFCCNSLSVCLQGTKFVFFAQFTPQNSILEHDT